MDAKKAFKIGAGPEVLYLVFDRDSAQTLINELNVALRPKDQKGPGYEKFYLGMTGKILHKNRKEESWIRKSKKQYRL